VLEGPTPSGYGGGPPDRLPGMLGRGRVRFGATRYHRNGRGWRPLRNPYFMGIKSGRFGDLASLCWQGVRELAIQGAESEQPGRSNLPLFPEPPDQDRTVLQAQIGRDSQETEAKNRASTRSRA
jgi:hypothetical protein